MLLSPSTNADYSGSRLAAWYLIVAGGCELVPGCIHYFLPDGGAGVIAGLDLTHDRAAMLGAFAWMGSMQIPFGIALILVGWRFRTFVPLFLLLNLVERGLMALAGWVLRPPAGAHHPPEHYASVAAVVLLAGFLIVSLRGSRRQLPPPQAPSQEPSQAPRQDPRGHPAARAG